MKIAPFIEFLKENKGLMPIHYSDEFRNILYDIKDSYDKNSIESELAFLLISCEHNTEALDKYTLIDITDMNNKITFIQTDRIIKKFPDLYKNRSEDDIHFVPGAILNNKSGEFWNSSIRTEVGVGKWSRRVIKEVRGEKQYVDSDIEKFVNAYKYSHDKKYKDYFINFKIIKGEEIRKWYLVDNYKVKTKIKDGNFSETLGSSLHKSCMRYSHNQSFFDIYTKNPEVCSLLILMDTEEPDKILGRALLWKTREGVLYQDRIYSIYGHHEKLFLDWANVKSYKTDKNYNKNLTVQLGNHEYDYYPYMDTFTVYDTNEHILYYDEDSAINNGADNKFLLELNSTDGIGVSLDTVYSEFNGEMINRNDAVLAFYLPNAQDYYYENQVVFIKSRNQIWSIDSEYIVYSYKRDKYFFSEDTVFSELEDDYLCLVNDEIISVIVSEDYDETDYCLEKSISLYFEYNGEYYDRAYFMIDPSGEGVIYTGKKDNRNDLENRVKEYIVNHYGHVPTREEVEQELIDYISKKKYPDSLLDEIKNHPIYKDKIIGLYWGLSNERNLSEQDILYYMISKMVHPYKGDALEMLKKINTESYDRMKVCIQIDRLYALVIKITNYFDYYKMGGFIYNHYLFLTK
jgi:hypothetical protein